MNDFQIRAERIKEMKARLAQSHEDIQIGLAALLAAVFLSAVTIKDWWW